MVSSTSTVSPSAASWLVSSARDWTFKLVLLPPKANATASSKFDFPANARYIIARMINPTMNQQ
eukprot:351140-Chlamydomonas_euryale.AAC.46